MVVVDAFDVSRATQGLQPADMRADEGFGILPLSFELSPNALQVPAGPVDLVLLAGVEGNIAISGPWTGSGRPHLHDHVAADVLQMRSIGKLHVMDAAINAVDHEIDPLVHLIVG